MTPSRKGSGRLVRLANATDVGRVGPKAASLAAAMKLGLTVPEGFVVPGALLVNLESDLADEILSALGQLPGPWAIRSSAHVEDLAGFSAAGLFHSAVGVDDEQETLSEVKRCARSGLSEAGRGYLSATGRPSEEPVVSVVVQRTVKAVVSGVMFTRWPGEDGGRAMVTEMSPGPAHLVTSGLAQSERIFWAADGSDVHLPDWAPEGLGAVLRSAAQCAEQVAGGPADVEWAVDQDETLWILQIRPITAPGAPATSGHSRIKDDEWAWDAEHNPDPLSPAHASLVELLDDPALSMRFQVRRDYLFCRFVEPDADAPAQKTDFDETTALVENALDRLEQSTATNAARSPTEAEQHLEKVIENFLRFFRLYMGQLVTILNRSKKELRNHLTRPPSLSARGTQDFLSRLRPGSTPLAALAQLARSVPPELRPEDVVEGGMNTLLSSAPELRRSMDAFLKRYGALAPAWDVMSPTWAENPEQLLRFALRGRVASAASISAQAYPEDPLLEVLGRDEEDDLLFARALSCIRRTLLDLSERLTDTGRLEKPADVFFLKLETLRRALSDASYDLRSDVKRARGNWLEARAHPPGGSSQAVAPEPGAQLRGIAASPGTVRARAQIVRSLSELPEPADFESDEPHVLVCTAITPGMAPALIGASAVVAETGGLLSHGAILARELGVPAVTGVDDATTRIPADSIVWVDGGRGIVTVLDRPGP